MEKEIKVIYYQGWIEKEKIIRIKSEIREPRGIYNKFRRKYKS